MSPFIFLLGDDGELSLPSTLLAPRFLEEPVRFFAALRTCFEILASFWKTSWRSEGLALEMVSMLTRLAF